MSFRGKRGLLLARSTCVDDFVLACQLQIAWSYLSQEGRAPAHRTWGPLCGPRFHSRESTRAINVAPRIRLKTQPLIGILIVDIRDRLFILHLRRIHTHRLQQHTKLALDPANLVCNRLVHPHGTKRERRSLIALLRIAECNDGEAVVVILSSAREESGDAVGNSVELCEVLYAVLRPVGRVSFWIVVPVVAVNGPGKNPEDFQSRQVRKSYLVVLLVTDQHSLSRSTHEMLQILAPPPSLCVVHTKLRHRYAELLEIPTPLGQPENIAVLWDTKACRCASVHGETIRTDAQIEILDCIGVTLQTLNVEPTTSSQRNVA